MNFTLIQAITAEDKDTVGSVILKNEDDLKQYNNSRVPGNLIIDCSFNTSYDLTLIATKNITFRENSTFTIYGNGSLRLKSGIEDCDFNGTVVFDGHEKPQIFVENEGKVFIYYNPVPDHTEKHFIHKYHNPSEYTASIFPSENLFSYMLVNNIRDLQNIMLFLHANYALSQNINASDTERWNNDKGFKPLTNAAANNPFTGNFDGNGYTIDGLYIRQPNSTFVGLFGEVLGYKSYYSTIENLDLKNFQVNGKNYVGALIGSAQYTVVKNVSISSVNITGVVAGGLIGTATASVIEKVLIKNEAVLLSGEYTGEILGSTNGVEIYDSYHQCQNNSTIQCIGFSHKLLYMELEE